MDTTTSFILRFARPSESKVGGTHWWLNRQILQRIATQMSLVSQAIGFSILGILMIVNRHQADLTGLAGAMIGGISAILVATVLFVAACLHWRFCARHRTALPVRRQSFRLTLN
jgi:hypothetical protein